VLYNAYLNIITYKKVNYITYSALYGTNLNQNKMSKEEKLNMINKVTQEELTMEHVKQNAKEYGISVDEMLDLVLENIEENL
jgi:hypothetical protein